MNDEGDRTLTLEIANIRQFQMNALTKYREFFEMCLASQYIGLCGISYAKEVLERAYGAENYGDNCRISASLQVHLILCARLKHRSY